MRDDGGGERRAGRIVEVEAYDGPDDRASHARFGRTARNGSMFAVAGTAYVYLVYGMHDLLNVSVGPGGEPAAALVRAIEPTEGLERMRAARRDRLSARRRTRPQPGDLRPEPAGRTTPNGRTTATGRATPNGRTTPADLRLASGPGLVTAVLGVDRSMDGWDLLLPGAPLRLEPAGLRPDERVAVGARVGIAYAGEPWVGMPWRFSIAGNPSVSGAPRPRSVAHASDAPARGAERLPRGARRGG